MTSVVLRLRRIRNCLSIIIIIIIFIIMDGEICMNLWKSYSLENQT